MTVWQGEMAHHLPGLWTRLDPETLAALPTPVARLETLGAELGHGGLYIKRDDLSSTIYGDNKVRKLEFLLAGPQRQDRSTVLTMGGIGSHHLLATALHARRLDLATVGVVFPQPENDHVRAVRAAHSAAGARLVPIRSKYLLPAAVAATLLSIRLRQGRRALLVPGGGSSPLGALGFVNAGLELAAQVAEGLLPEPDEIYLAYGTGGTAAGLWLGLRLGGLQSRVVAVRVIDRIVANRLRLHALVGSIAKLLHSGPDAIRHDFHLDPSLEIRQGYLGGGYGHATQEATQSVELFARHQSLPLEPTYTGKAAAAFIARARTHPGPLLFWNTYAAEKGFGQEEGFS